MSAKSIVANAVGPFAPITKTFAPVRGVPADRVNSSDCFAGTYVDEMQSAITGSTPFGTRRMLRALAFANLALPPDGAIAATRIPTLNLDSNSGEPNSTIVPTISVPGV